MTLDAPAIEAIFSKTNPDQPFSGVVRVQQGDTLITEQAYGFANYANHIPNTPETRFGIASGCKGFTAVAILQLIEAGKLTLETPVQECLDIPFPTWDAAVTIRHLLTHTSGIGDYFDEEVDDDFGALWLARPTYTIRTPRDFVPMFQERPMKFTPGARFSYNNAGFIVLGLVVEAISGQPFTDYIMEHIFAPSGMMRSGYFALDQLPPQTALGYFQDEDNAWHTNIYSIPVVGGPDGGAFTTAEDMAHFWAALREHRLLKPDLTTQMLTPQVATERAGRSYGLGIWIDHEGETVVDYLLMGGDPGVAFVAALFPATELQITLLGNTEDALWPIYGKLRAQVAG